MAAITSIQAGMIVALAHTYNCTMTLGTAVGLAGTAGCAVGGRMLFQALLKCIPGLGTVGGAVIGAAVAGPLTLALGYSFRDLFAGGNFRPTMKEIQQRMEKNRKKAEAQASALNMAASRLSGRGDKV